MSVESLCLVFLAGELSESLRPKSRQGPQDGEVAQFTMSSRPLTSHGKDEADNDLFAQTRSDKLHQFDVSEIVYYTSDWTISNISDNPKAGVRCHHSAPSIFITCVC